MLFLLFTTLAMAADPLIQFEQAPDGTRTAAISAACSADHGVYLLSSPSGEIVNGHITRFAAPTLTEINANSCRVICPEGSRLLAVQLARGGKGTARNGILCLKLETRASRKRP